MTRVSLLTHLFCAAFCKRHRKVLLQMMNQDKGILEYSIDPESIRYVRNLAEEA